MQSGTDWAASSARAIPAAARVALSWRSLRSLLNGAPLLVTGNLQTHPHRIDEIVA
jgi:hypothetical protein